MRSIAQGYQEAAWQEGIERTAKNMLAKGLDTQFISEMTGLAREALNKLQANGQA